VCAAAVGWSATAQAYDDGQPSKAHQFFLGPTSSLPSMVSLFGAYLSGPVLDPLEFSARASALSSFTSVVVQGSLGGGTPGGAVFAGAGLAHVVSGGLGAALGLSAASLGGGPAGSSLLAAAVAVFLGEWLAPRLTALIDGWLADSARASSPGLGLPTPFGWRR
jgi:hypothetical protein